MPICNKCKKELDESYFYRNKNGILILQCKKCNKIRTQEWVRNNREKRLQIQAKYREVNREKLREKSKQYCSENKELISKRQLKYRLKEPERVKAVKDRYRLKNREKCNKATAKSAKHRLATNPKHRMLKNLRDRIYHALLNGKGAKSKPTKQLLGCSVDECKTHLTNLFEDGMSWDNYSKYTWNIDHIIPCDHFNLLDIKEQEKCFHYTNLQPLWFEDNSNKQNKLPKDFNYRVWDENIGWQVIIYAA